VTLRLQILLVSLLLTGCTEAHVWREPEAVKDPPFRRVFVTAECEHCNVRALERALVKGLAAHLTPGQVVSRPEEADTIIKYKEGDSVIILDEPEEFEFIPNGIRLHPHAGEEKSLPNSWWWNAEIYRAPGQKTDLVTVLYGSVNKLRGRPLTFFLKQFRNYVPVIDESGEDYLYPKSWFGAA
jgi:hypothetical protein